MSKEYHAPPFYVVVDSNIIVSEQAFLTAVGHAFIYFLAGSGGKLGLPEVVKLEVGAVVRSHAADAIRRVSRDTAFLRQLSGHPNFYLSPTELAVKDGLNERWQNLRGVMQEIAFNEGQARSALQRVISKLPPAGKNNEQFCDCCIWVSAKELARNSQVYLISADHAFYQGGKIGGKLSEPLALEIEAEGLQIGLFENLQAFMSFKQPENLAFDEGSAKALITEAATPLAYEYAAKNDFQISDFIGSDIHGYALPEPYKIALSFSLSFSFLRLDKSMGTIRGKFEVGGNCSLNLQEMTISEMSANSWSQSVSDIDGASYSRSDLNFGRDVRPEHVRLLK